jgi:aminoglycoside phosphotransferase (APT) family kinase protein
VRWGYRVGLIDTTRQEDQIAGSVPSQFAQPPQPLPAPPPELVRALLREAAIAESPQPLVPLGLSTSSVWALDVAGAAYVVRWRLDGDARMVRKEAYLSDLLQQHAVPAPQTLAAVAGEHGVATLSTRLPGIRLDIAIEGLSEDERPQAWRVAGEALRRAHEIAFPAAGEIVGDRVSPFPAPWGDYMMDGLAGDLWWLQAAVGGPPVDAALLERVVAAARLTLRERPARLLHNDALPQNVLVAPSATGPDGWRCTGWLDWEFARAGDPLWDVATLDFRPAGLVPDAFYAGYGHKPPEPQASVYDLLMAAWRTRAELDGHGPWRWPPQAARLAYLRDLPSRLAHLAGALGVRG